MAKLSAHGTEVYRLVKEADLVQDRPTAAKKERMTVSIRSDLAVMRNRKVLFPPMFEWDSEKDKWHDFGWKLYAWGSAIKARGHTAESLRDLYINKHGYRLDL